MNETSYLSIHLSTLIAKVREDEQQFGYATKEHLINIAEYMISWPSKYSQEEYSQAIRLLAQYHLAKLANLSPRRRIMTWRLINKELAKPYKARCRRCGLPMTNPVSLAAGHGPVCRRKLGLQNKPVREPSAT
jgi:hypothetical protein